MVDAQSFLEQLQIVLDPSRGNVKAATDVLQKEYYPHPESLSLLLQLITSHDDAHLRQLAAVEARSLVNRHWRALPDNQRPHIRSQLLQATVAEQNTLPRHASARLISAIAKLDLPEGEWEELPPFLRRASTSDSANERAIGVYILFTIIETLGDGFSERFNDLFALLSRTIRDPDSAEVRINTMLALSKLAMLFDSDEDEEPVKKFQAVFPSMVAVLKDSIDTGAEERTMQAFEVFQTLLGCDPKLMSNHLKDLVVFMMEISVNKQLPDETKTQALSFLMSCVKYRKLKVQGMKIGEQLVKASMQIIAENPDDTDDDGELTPSRTALGLIDTLAQLLPPGQVIVPLLHSLGPYVNSQDPNHRTAGMLALGMVVEGAPEFISTQLKEIIPLVVRLLNDPNEKVRMASLTCVNRLAEDLPEDTASHHAALMPAVVKNLDAAMRAYKGEESGTNIEMMKAATGAIDAVTSGMDSDEVKPYLGPFMPIMQRLMKHPDLKVKALAAGAIGSLASSAEEAFSPFLTDTVNALKDYVLLKDSEEELDLRASVIDAMGEIAGAVGGQQFHPYVEPLMDASEKNLHLDHSKLKETTYILWGALARAYEEEFKPFLDGVVKGLFDCLEQDEKEIEVELGEDAKDLVGQEVTIAGLSQKIKVAAAEDDDDDGDIEDIDIEDDEWDDFDTVGPISLEKEIAIEVIGQVLAYTKTAYLPYLEKTITTLLPMLEHAYEGVRKATISTLFRAYGTIWEIQVKEGHMQKFKPGLPLKVQPTAELKKLGELLMTATMSFWPEEDDSIIVIEVNRSLSDTLKLTGPALISDPSHLKIIVETITAIIKKEHPCQMDEFAAADADGEDLDETPEQDWLIIDTALDIISGCAVALGPQFPEMYKMFEKPIMRFASSSEGLERSAAVGVIAEVTAGMEAAVTPYSSSILKILLKRLSDEHQQTKSNAAYAIGRLCEKSNDTTGEILKAYPTILQKLEPLLRTEGTERMQDNGAGAACRMIIKHPQAVPIDQVLPVVVDLLPLKKDYEENEPIYNCIAMLYDKQHPTIRDLTPKLIPVFKAVLSATDEPLTEETKVIVTKVAQYLKGMNPAWDCGV